MQCKASLSLQVFFRILETSTNFFFSKNSDLAFFVENRWLQRGQKKLQKGLQDTGKSMNTSMVMPTRSAGCMPVSGSMIIIIFFHKNSWFRISLRAGRIHALLMISHACLCPGVNFVYRGCECIKISMYVTEPFSSKGFMVG